MCLAVDVFFVYRKQFMSHVRPHIKRVVNVHTHTQVLVVNISLEICYILALMPPFMSYKLYLSKTKIKKAKKN